MAAKGFFSRAWESWESKVDMPRATAVVIVVIMVGAGLYGAYALWPEPPEGPYLERVAFSPDEERFILEVAGINKPVVKWEESDYGVSLCGPDYLGTNWTGEYLPGYVFNIGTGIDGGSPLKLAPAERGLVAAEEWGVRTVDGNATIKVTFQDLDGDRKISNGDRIVFDFPFPLGRDSQGSGSKALLFQMLLSAVPNDGSVVSSENYLVISARGDGGWVGPASGLQAFVN